MAGSPVKRKRKQNTESFCANTIVTMAIVTDEIKAGKTLVDVCRLYDLHYGTLSDWVQGDEDRAAQYRAALTTRKEQHKDTVVQKLQRILAVDLQDSQVEIKDQLKAAELLGKHLGIFMDKVEHSVDKKLEDLLESSQPK